VLSASTGRAVAGEDTANIAKDIGVSYVLRGDMAKNPQGTVLTAEMINASTGEVLWSETFATADGDLFSLQTKLAERIWTSLGIQPRPLERLQVERSHTTSAAAYELYLIGRYQMASRTAADLRNAIGTFSASLKEDAGFAPAYVGLADAYALLNLYDIEPPANAYELAEQYISRALEIDDNLAEAHATRAYIRFYARRDREGAELDFRRAIQVNPSYAQAHHWFALVLTAMKRQVEAQSEAQIAQRLDPRSLAIKSATGMTYFFNDQITEAIVECDKALAIDQSFIPALKVKRWAYAAAGGYDLARAAFEKELHYNGGSPQDPGWKIIEAQILPPAGDQTAQLTNLRTAAANPVVSRNPFAFAYEVALAFNNLGDREKAFEFLERAEAAKSHGFNFLEVDPRLSNLHNDPRFTRLLRKLNARPN
jgi:tetratricopeptide (TPR) repeat protein